MVQTDSRAVAVLYYNGRYAGELHPEAATLRARLAPARAQRLDRLLNMRERALHLAALKLLEMGMARAGHGDFRLADVRYDAGKPAWRDVDFSLTHAAGIAVVAIGRGVRVGVDVEPRGAATVEVVRRLLAPAAAVLPPLNAENATSSWTQLEAVVKAAGIGVFDAKDIEWQSDGARCRGVRWYWQSIDVGAAHVAHLALDSPHAAVDVVNVRSLYD